MQPVPPTPRSLGDSIPAKLDRPERPRRRFLASFGHAANGLVDAVVQGGNMRVHVVCGLLVSLVGSGVALGLPERLALLLCVVLVLAAEAFNTALENAVDLIIDRYDERARLAKDAAAGAVLALAMGAVAILGAILVADWSTISREGSRIARQVAAGAPLAACATVLLLPFPRPWSVDVIVASIGAVLMGLLATWSANAFFTVLGALLFVLCVAAAFRRRITS